MHPAELAILLHRALEARIGRLLELAARPEWAADPEGLHDVRVASRRVRAVLDLVDPAVYPGYRRHLRRLRRLTATLGITRELDVHTALLEAFLDAGSAPLTRAALEHALEALARRARRARQRMTEALPRLKVGEAADLLRVPSLPDPFLRCDLSRAVWDLLEPRLAAALADLPALVAREDAEALHAARIRVKQARYALEVLSGAFAAPVDDALEGLRTLQTALGHHHDHATLETFLWRLHGGLAARGRTALVDGLMEPLGLVAEARRAHFEALRGLVPGWDPAAFPGSLRARLGLPEDPA